MVALNEVVYIFRILDKSISLIIESVETIIFHWFFIRYVEVSVKSSEDILDSEVVFGLNKDISNDSMESVNKNTNIGKHIYILSLGISLSAVSGAVFTLLKIRKNK